MEAELAENLQPVKIDSLQKHPLQAAFLRLPFELRRSIYNYALFHTLSHSPEEIYFAVKPIKRLPPASLYFVNRQIRHELCAVISEKPNLPLTLHIHPRGTLYSSFSETQILAGKDRDVTRASKIHIYVWPPHPNRQATILDIWRCARDLQRQLLEAAVHLEAFWLDLLDNEVASWCQNDRILDTLDPDYSAEAQYGDTGRNDVTKLAQVFCRVRAERASICCSAAEELDMPTVFPKTSDRLSDICLMMKGKLEIPHDYYIETTLNDEFVYENKGSHERWYLKDHDMRTAFNTLMERTRAGEKKLTVTEWEQFLELWDPRFDELEFQQCDFKVMENFCRGLFVSGHESEAKLQIW